MSAENFPLFFKKGLVVEFHRQAVSDPITRATKYSLRKIDERDPCLAHEHRLSRAAFLNLWKEWGSLYGGVRAAPNATLSAAHRLPPPRADFALGVLLRALLIHEYRVRAHRSSRADRAETRSTPFALAHRSSSTC